MFAPKLIKTDAEYEAALEEIERLWKAESGTPDGDRVELLVHLVNQYEQEHHPIEDVDPITVIKQVMLDRGLKLSDVAEFFGGKNRASEVLSGKRQLNLKMVRALHKGLGIPAEAFLREGETLPSEGTQAESWPTKLLREIQKRLPNLSKFDPTNDGEDLQQALTELSGLTSEACAAFRAGRRAGNGSDPQALTAWLMTAMAVARERMVDVEGRFSPESLPGNFLTGIAQLSVFPNGPLLAQERLAQLGILLIVVPHFSKTYLDGAAFFVDGAPVVALTLRYDAWDKFFFDLLHELAHILRGDAAPGKLPLVEENIGEVLDGEHETAANALAGESIVPPEAVAAHPAFGPRARQADITSLARQLGVDPSLVAGRIRHERKQHQLFPRLRKTGVRELFGEERA